MKRLACAAVVVAALIISLASGQAPHAHIPELPPRPEGVLRSIGLLLREGKTDDARRQIRAELKSNPETAELYHQLARSYLIDFYALQDAEKRRTSLALAMEALSNTLARNADHIPALQAKAVIHARAELLFYDPNLAFQLAARVARLQPSASEYLLNLTEWLSGEVRFNAESEHRVPHDPLLGLDRTIQLLDRVLDSAMPYSNEESLAFYAMARALSKRGNYRESIRYFEIASERPANSHVKGDILREHAVSLYRLGQYGEAAHVLYRALQIRMTAIDRWLLQLSLDSAKDPGIRLPDALQFPVADPPAASGAALAFEDIAPKLGLDRMDGNGTCSWGDYDSDGKQDLFLAGSGTFLAVYRNEGAKFREVTAEVGLARVPSGYSLNVVDYDNDGRPDLYVTLNGWSGPMKNRLFRNVGGKYVDVSEESGAADGGSGFISLWADFDNDGHLDFVVANGVLKDGSLPQIYRNTGSGKFVNMTKEAGWREPHTWGAIGAALGDYDRDGDIDIFINGLINSPNRLYRNDGNFRFTEVTKQAGLHQQPFHNGFVAMFTDYNNDTWPDLLVTSLAPWEAVVDGLSRAFRPPRVPHPDATRLFRNKGDGTFADVTAAAGLATPMGVMGAGVADLDNDGFVDFYFGTGDPQLSRLEPNRLFRNNGDGTFTDWTGTVGFARPGNKGHGVSFIDLDGDGDLEVYAQLGGHYPGDHARNALYRNLKGNSNSWLEVELTPATGNRNAIGATVTVRAGALTVVREVKGSEAFGATNPYVQHFGLGTATTVDSLEVRWPSGKIQRFTGVEPKRIVRIREGEKTL